MTKISALLPVYNTNRQFLEECTESILNQTFKDFELLILDDGSTNDIKEIISQYDDKRIKYYRESENLGITKARNKLLELASGEYIAICDHDDISYPKRFEKEYKFLEKNKHISLVSSWIEYFPKPKIAKKPALPKYLDFLQSCAAYHPACMWRKKDFEKFNLRYEDGYYGAQDYKLFAEAIKYLNFANLQEPLLRYRLHENNASNHKRAMTLETAKVQNEMIQFLTANKRIAKMLRKKFIEPKNFLQHICSFQNRGLHKYITVLGITIKIKRKIK